MLVKDFLKRWMDVNYFYLDEQEVYNNLSLIPNRQTQDPILPEDWNTVLNYLQQIKNLINKYAADFQIYTNPQIKAYYDSFVANLSKLINVDFDVIIQSQQYNIRRECLNALSYLYRKPPIGIYLFNENAWSEAKQFVTDSTMVICSDYTSTIPPKADIEYYLNNYKVVFVKEIDTGPYHRRKYYQWYNIIYNITDPRGETYTYTIIQNDLMRSKIGSDILYLSFDYGTRIIDKITNAIHWGMIESDYSFSYVFRGEGGVFEVPFDGYWRSVSILTNMVRSMSEIVLDEDWPLRIIYIGHYVTDNPPFHGGIANIATMWQTIANNRNIPLHDKRRS